MDENSQKPPVNLDSVASAKALTLTDKFFAVLFCVMAVVGLLGSDLAVWALPGIVALAVIFKKLLSPYLSRP